MGGIVSRIWWGGVPDAVQAYSGLSHRDIYTVQKTWAVVYCNAAENGIEIFKRLFHANPETKNFFINFRNLSDEELDKSHQFRAHVINLMSSLNLAITNLHQPEVTAALMNKLGESHGKRGIREEHLLSLKDVMLEMLNSLLGLDESALVSWNKTIDFIYKHIFQTLH
ncbi:globin [Danaus plexippus plexippus]|uniref:Globin n=1 Tax=Danaus plexippus plexippus TaxID=278856 RepID=A0A212F1Q5_DANPL|nr:cytoglobin-like [Danaus plexippus plexippus]OWR47670.1 globin [Danaus plexippus plexippus]